MGIIGKLLGRHREIIAVAARQDAERVVRELRALPAVCGEATKSGKPCLVVPAHGYQTCSRHGGRNAAPVKAAQSKAAPVKAAQSKAAGQPSSKVAQLPSRPGADPRA